MNKKILHLDMDAFFASVEQAANPKLKNRPVIVGSRTNKYRTVVAACSYEAKAFGIASGMSTKEAFRLCPEATFVPADCAKYIYTAEEILRLLQEFSPQTEMASIDEFYLDITGCQGLFGSFERIACLIKQKICQRFGITGSIGIAPNKLMAKLASKVKKPNGLVIWEENNLADILKNLPVEKICGIGPQISLKLHQMAIFTCGQLAQVPEPLLLQRFGKYGAWLKQAARGEDTNIVNPSAQPDLPPKSVGHSYTLEKDVSNIELIQAWIGLLCEMVASRLRNLALQGSVVQLYLRGANLKWWSKQKNFTDPSFDGQCLYNRSLMLLKKILPQATAIRALGITVSSLVAANHAYLFEQDKKRQKLMVAQDQINTRFGDWVIYPARLAVIRP